jgi:hypothetical protein
LAQRVYFESYGFAFLRDLPWRKYPETRIKSRAQVRRKNKPCEMNWMLLKIMRRFEAYDLIFEKSSQVGRVF